MRSRVNKARSLRDRLRGHLHRFPRYKVGRFLEAVRIITEVAPIMSTTMPRNEGSARLERIQYAAEELISAISEMPFLYVGPPEPVGDKLALLLRSIETAGGAQAWGKASQELIEGRRPGMPGAERPQRSDEEIQAELRSWEDELQARKERRMARLHGEIDSEPAKRWREDPQQAIWELNQAAYEARMAVGTLLHELRDMQDASAAAAPRPRHTGRPAADNQNILREVAAAYRRHLGEMPVTTRGGVFYNLVVEITGQTSPERAVRAAVAALQKKNDESPPRAD